MKKRLKVIEINEDYDISTMTESVEIAKSNNLLCFDEKERYKSNLQYWGTHLIQKLGKRDDPEICPI